MSSSDSLELIPISRIEHYVYCPRQCALIHLEQEFVDNHHTMRGNAVHELVDEEGVEVTPGIRIERALPLFSTHLGLIGKADVVEFHANGQIYPIEYKHGNKRDKLHDDLQLCAQTVCLEEMLGKKIERGAIFYHSSRRRREVAITQTLKEQLRLVVMAMREMFASPTLPPPVNDKRCRACSLSAVCQPEALAVSSRFNQLNQALFDDE